VETLLHDDPDCKTKDEAIPKHPAEGNPAYQEALYLAFHGFRVFPVCGLDQENTDRGICLRPDCRDRDRGKHPLIKGYQKYATTDLETIRQWWTDYPLANVGIITGDDWFVFDMDPRNGGEQSLSELQTKYGELPETVRVRTGGDGWHYYLSFFWQSGISIKNRQSILPGIDIKGQGGYVVGPGSLHLSGKRYEWELSSAQDLHDVGLAEAPDWLIKLITEEKHGRNARPEPSPAAVTSSQCKKSNGQPAVEVMDYPDDIILKGRKNETLFREARHMKDRWLSEKIIRNYIRLRNSHDCRPPLSERELTALLTSALRPEYLRPSRKPGPSQGALSVYRWLKQACGSPWGLTWKQIANEEVARGTGLSERYVTTCINRLVKHGLLRVEGIDGQANQYLPLLPPPSQETVPLGDEQGMNNLHSFFPLSSSSSY